MLRPHTLAARFSLFLIALLLVGCAPSAEVHSIDPPPAVGSQAARIPLLEGTQGRALPQPPLRNESLRLAILPDRTTGRPWGMPYLERAMHDLERTRPDAILTVGDLVQGYTRSTQRYRFEVEEFLSYLNMVEIPFYPAAGNHDIVSGSRVAGDQTFVHLYKELFGPLYYAVDFGLAYVVVLSTEDLAASSQHPVFEERQLAFLDRALAQGVKRGAPIFVLMHKPAWRYRNSNFLDQVHPRLVAAGVKAVFAGHFHSLQRDEDRDGVEYHLLSVCGGMIDQHPLTGQFHHVTYINVDADGEFSVYHSPVGHTLPDDWIAREDQDRAFRLKTRSAGQFSPLPQPLHRAVSGSVVVEVRNPIDLPIRVNASLVDALPDPVLVKGEHFYSMTERDIFSKHNTHADTPFRMVGGSGTIYLEPGERAEFVVELEAEAQTAMMPPPEVHLLMHFADSKEREVPIVVRRRVPLTMSVDLSQGEIHSLLLWAWEVSVYDNDEPVPTLTLARSGDDLYLALHVPDDVVAVWDRPLDDYTRVNNPLGDCVIVRIDDKRYLIEPFAEEHKQVHEVLEHEGKVMLVPSQRLVSAARRTPDGYGLRMVVRDVTWPARLNVKVADNDETFHTQWRQLAPMWVEPVGIEVR